MWRKAALFGDHAAALKILESPHPRAAKALGGRVTGFDQQVWDEHRIPIVVAGNLAKFRQHPPLSAFLVTPAGGSWSRPAPSTGSGASA